MSYKESNYLKALFKFMSQKASEKDKSGFLQYTALVHPEQRDIIGQIEMFEIVTGDRETLKDFKDAIRAYGIARHKRDIVTNLGYYLGSTGDVDEDLSDLFEKLSTSID
jgi:hypothetical protein